MPAARIAAMRRCWAMSGFRPVYLPAHLAISMPSAGARGGSRNRRAPFARPRAAACPAHRLNHDARQPGAVGHQFGQVHNAEHRQPRPLRPDRRHQPFRFRQRQAADPINLLGDHLRRIEGRPPCVGVQGDPHPRPTLSRDRPPRHDSRSRARPRRSPPVARGPARRCSREDRPARRGLGQCPKYWLLRVHPCEPVMQQSAQIGNYRSYVA